MAITAGETLSLNGLAAATGQTTKSLSAAKGNTTGPIALSSFGIDAVGSLSGYTYLVENTNEAFTLGFTGAGSNFSRISTRSANFTWLVTSGTLISLTTNNGASATFSVGDMANPDNILDSVVSHNIRVTFADGFNDHATGYNTPVNKTIYSVDSYDGNTSALCLTADSPIFLSDGTIKEIGDIEEGDVLRGYRIDGITTIDNTHFLDLSNSSLDAVVSDVVVENVIFSFAEKIYTINDGEVSATAEHPMFIKDSTDDMYRFKQIGRLSIGDKLIKHTENSNLEEIEVTSITVNDETTEIVSIDVSGDDTYLVNGYITHNKDEGNTHVDMDGPTAPTVVSYTHPNLTWSGGAADAVSVSGITAYDVQISTSATFSVLAKDESNWDVASMQLAGGFIAAGTYYARVRNVQSGLKSAWKTSTAFSVVI